MENYRWEQQCCCLCFRLETGAKIIAITGSIISLILIISGPTLYFQEEDSNLRIACIHWTIFASGLISLILNLSLIYGLQEKRYKLIQPWINLNWLGLILSVISASFAVIFYPFHENLHLFLAGIFYPILGIPAIYFWNVVNWVYLDMRKQSKNHQSKSEKIEKNTEELSNKFYLDL